MPTVTVHTGTTARREITIEGCETVQRGVAAREQAPCGRNEWNIYLNNGDVLYSPSVRMIEFTILKYLKGHMQ